MRNRSFNPTSRKCRDGAANKNLNFRHQNPQPSPSLGCTNQEMTLYSSYMATTFQTLPKIKFLGLILDSKLLWKDHISMVVNKCTRLKNVFYIISKATYAPNIKSLCTLFKSFVRSRIGYVSASKTHLQKIDTTSRSILRIILG